MRLLETTLPTPAENLAFDEALLEEAESLIESPDSLRLWESPDPAVIIGRSSRVSDEVDLPQLARQGIPVLRRCSGGAAVMIGPGCLMYSVVLSSERRPALRWIERAHEYVLGRMVDALTDESLTVERAGTSDLVYGDRKFSGNSLRCKRRCLLYHGTLLYDFPLRLVSECLRTPPRQPDYRRSRDHAQFITNLPMTRSSICARLVEAWSARQDDDPCLEEATRVLAGERYSNDDWNLRR